MLGRLFSSSLHTHTRARCLSGRMQQRSQLPVRPWSFFFRIPAIFFLLLLLLLFSPKMEWTSFVSRNDFSPSKNINIEIDQEQSCLGKCRCNHPSFNWNSDLYKDAAAHDDRAFDSHAIVSILSVSPPLRNSYWQQLLHHIYARKKWKEG